MKDLRLIGPVHIVNMKKGDKQVMLISDIHYHYNKGGCKWNLLQNRILSSTFLEELFQKDKTKEWDLYMENLGGKETFYEHRRYTRKNFSTLYENCINDKNLNCTNMELILNYFGSKGCFTNLKCDINNARFHMIDIRQRNFFGCGKISPFPVFDLNQIISSLVYRYYLEDRKELSVFKSLFLEDINLYKNLSINLEKCFSNESKVFKQIEKSEMKTEIMSYFKDSISQSKRFLKMIISGLNRNQDKLVDFFLKNLPKFNTIEEFSKFYIKIESKFLLSIFDPLASKLVKEKYSKFLHKNSFMDDKVKNLSKPLSILGVPFNIASLLMDLYTIGRIFRKFDKKKQKNIVIVAGIFHTDNYYQFLIDHGFNIDFEGKKESERCQVIPDILS